MYEIGVAIIMALVVSLSIYAAKLPKGEIFQPYKLVRTLIVGAVLGVVAYFSGFALTTENWETYLLANAGIIGFVDQLVKLGWRLQPWFKEDEGQR